MSKKKIFRDENDWYERNERKNRDKARRDKKQQKKEKEKNYIEEWNTEK